jgi:Glycine-zipper domain
MRIVTCTSILNLLLLLLISSVWGQQLYIYPSQGQSAQQQQQDRADCHMWSVQQTGYDPSRAPMAPPPTQGPQGEVVRGGARGAALGAVGGAIGGDAGKGAAIGAATGALFGGMRRAERSQQEQAAQQQYAAASAQQQASYNRALSACLSGRGYTIQ